MNNTDCILKSETRRAESHATGPSGSGTVPRRFWEWGIILIVAAVYLAHLAPGHNFRDDDFGAYVMHAANLAEGRPYTAIHYIPNPETLWLAPPEGYPPVYPFLLAPVYQVWGLNLRALKVVTVLCFAGFLLVFSEFLRPFLSPALSCCALFMVGCNPVFWGQRDVLLAESPYLLFSFAALLAIQRAYRNLSADQWRIGTAALVGLSVYLAYGTRTIGIVLLPAIVLADVIKFRKPSRFLMSALVVAIGLIFLQNLLLFSPLGYSGAVQHSVRMGLGNVLFYAKTLSYAWQNGFSKKIQIVFALLFTTLAAMNLVRSLWTQRSATEFYLLSYVVMLLFLRAEIGMRGLLPILPLYFAFGLEGFGWIVDRYEQMIRIACVSLLLLFVGVSYGNEIRKESLQPPEPNIQDPAAQELFSFLRAHTQQSDVLVFLKPRVLALMTNRTVAMLAPAEPPEESARFIGSINANIVVTAKWGSSSAEAYLEQNQGHVQEVFRNAEYQAFRVLPEKAGP